MAHRSQIIISCKTIYLQDNIGRLNFGSLADQLFESKNTWYENHEAGTYLFFPDKKGIYLFPYWGWV